MTTNPIPVKEALYQKKIISSPRLRTLGEMSTEEKTLLHQKLSQFEVSKQSYFSEQEKRMKFIKKAFGLRDRGRKYIPPTER